MRVLIHHSEIALKGKNRKIFERQLIKNIQNISRRNSLELTEIKPDNNRIIAEFKNKKEEIQQVLEKIFGIKNFAFCQEIEKNKKLILDECEKILRELKKKKINSVKAETKRSDKNFELKSQELNKLIGEIAVKLNFKIDLTNPDKKIFVEITKNKTYLFTEKIQCSGGLPVGSSGKVLCLLSGGIDSAVAAYLMMKRGCRVDFLHIHALKENKDVFKTKIPEIAKELDNYQFASKLFTIPYSYFQINSGKIPRQYELVLFKHFLLKCAEKIARKYNCRAIITGDSLGQVASQTLYNLAATSYNIDQLQLRPLISFDKNEIIELSKKINIFDLVNRPYKDCCSIVAKKSLTSIPVKDMAKIFEEFEINEVVGKSLNSMEIS